MTAEVRCRRERASFAAAVGGALLFVVVGADRAQAAPTERYAQREGLSCAACHVAASGGPLTAFGRDYRWRAPLVEDGVPPAQADVERGADATGAGAATSTAAPWWGRWSGEASIYGRGGRDRAFGQPTRNASLTESLRLRGDTLFGNEALSFRGEGFAQSRDASGSFSSEEETLDFSAAEVTWRGSSRGSFVRFGRQFVVAGAAVQRVDGVALRQPLGGAFELDLFGGAPTDDGIGGRNGDRIGGGRLGALLGSALKLGASAFYAQDHGDASDVKGGLDLQWSPTRSFELFSHAYYDWIADEIYDARAHAVWTPSIAWQVALDWTHAIPGLFVPKSSIYSVFSNEAYDEGGVTLTHRFDAALSANLFGRHTDYESSESLTQAGGGVDARYGPNGEDAVGAEAGWQDESRDSLGGSSTDADALFVRAYHLLWWTAAIYSSLDTSLQFVKDTAFGRDAALARLAVGYDPHGAWDLQVGTDWVRDPEFEDRLDLFARLRLRF